MKHYLLLLTMCIAFSSADAQGLFGNLKPKQERTYNITKTADGAVVVDSIVENIPLTATEISAAAKEYLMNSYKESKYTIVAEDGVKNSIEAQGQFLHFHDGKLGLNQYYLTVNFMVRVDAMNNRMRVSIIADKYQGECIDMNSTKEVDDKISEYQPLNQNNDSKRTLYSKAFPKLYDKMCLVKKDLVGFVASKIKTSISDDW